MAHIKNDLTGMKFGELTVIEYVGKGKWKCKCSCGNICEKYSTHLTGGYTKSCGHKNGSNKLKNMVGQKIGKLTVIEYCGNSHWKCLCECGEVVIIRGWELRNNKKTSCGKCENNKRLNDLTGKTIGYWKVNRYVGNKKWECTCTLCNRTYEVYTHNLISGSSKSCEECSAKLKIKNRKQPIIGSIDKYLGHGYYECTCGMCGSKLKRHGTLIDKSNEILCKHCSPLRLTKNMKGKVIGNWTVLEYVGAQRWLCKCNICSKESKVFGYNLRSGHSTSCGCQLRKGITNEKIGEWTVLGYVGDYYYRCQCSCGNIKNVLGYSLRSGQSKSCGCKKWDNIKNTLLTNYNEIAPTKIGKNTRNQSQINILNTKELLIDYIIKLGHKPTIYELQKGLGVETSTILKHIHRYEIENLVDINSRHSRQETDIVSLLSNIYEDSEITIGDRSILKGKEIDIYVPKIKLAFEINGTYWHSTVFKNKKYHQEKSFECMKQGIRLVHIFEYEWNDEETKAKLTDYLLNICDRGSNIRINARDCNIRPVDNDSYKLFCDKYHLQGYASASIILGLYKDEELIQIMSFGSARFNNNYQYELIRLCVKSGYIINGGSERLFKHFINEYKPESVISYCDISKFTGAVYERLGFKLKNYSDPGYVWVESSTNTVMQRYQTQKHKLLELGLGTSEQTEDDIMKRLGFLKIYNCGNAIYVYE